VDNRETREFIKLIADAYPTFEPTPGRVKLWVEFMEDIPFETAMFKLKKHIVKSKFAPTVSEIINSDNERLADYSGSGSRVV
jgi:hypothetical protein